MYTSSKTDARKATVIMLYEVSILLIKIGKLINLPIKAKRKNSRCIKFNAIAGHSCNLIFW